MFLSKERWFLNLIFCMDSFIITLNAAYRCGYDGNSFDQNAQFSYQCGRAIQISTLRTSPLNVGEEPFWDDQTRSLYFADVYGATVHRYFIDSNQHYYAVLGNNSVSVILPSDRLNKYIITFGNALCILSWNGKSGNASFQIIEQPDPAHPKNVLDDAKVGPNYELFVFSIAVPTTSLEDVTRNQSSLFGIYKRKVTSLLTHLQLGNGLGFSGCKKSFYVYHSDTVLRITYKSYFDGHINSIKYTRVLLDFAKQNISGSPDSLTVDKKGYVWIACYLGGQIIKVDPCSGDVICLIKLPTPGVTNMAFGRCPNVKNGRLDCLYVTTVSYNVSSPTVYDGRVLLIRNLGSEGVLPNKVKMDEFIG